MRILFLNWRDLDHPGAGGAEVYVHEVARRWADAGHEVTLFCSRVAGAGAHDTRDGVRIVRAGDRWTVYREARSFIATGRWDAVVESVNTRPFFAHRLAPGTPTVAIFHQLARDVWFHEAPLPLALAGRFVFEPRWLRRYRGARTVAVSDSTSRDLARVGVHSLAVAPPGTPTPPSRVAAKEAVPTIAFLGRMNPSKRPDAAVEAWRIVRRSVPDTRMWVLGDGPMRESLSAPEDGLTVFGRVDEMTKWDLLARAHLLLVPSVREGWGIVVMEAGVVGTPSVAYRVPGLVDAVQDGRTGWLTDPTPEAMAVAAVGALRDPTLAGTGARAETRARSFTWDAAAESILDTVALRQEVGA